MSDGRLTRVEWLPGSDLLRGRCHCSAEAEAGDPIAMWQWLQAHPDHPAEGPAEPAVTLPTVRPPAHLVTDPGQIPNRVPVFDADRRNCS